MLGERDAFFWRTHQGAELGLLVLRKGKRYGFEIKLADAPTMTKSMHVALEDLGLTARRARCGRRVPSFGRLGEAPRA
jgi:hypothetical protein